MTPRGDEIAVRFDNAVLHALAKLEDVASSGGGTVEAKARAFRDYAEAYALLQSQKPVTNAPRQTMSSVV